MNDLINKKLPYNSTLPHLFCQAFCPCSASAPAFDRAGAGAWRKRGQIQLTSLPSERLVLRQHMARDGVAPESPIAIKSAVCRRAAFAAAAVCAVFGKITRPQARFAAIPIAQHTRNAARSTATMVEPTGVESQMESSSPETAQTTERAAEKTVTLLKL